MGHEDHDLPEIHADRVAHTLSFPGGDDHDDEEMTPEMALESFDTNDDGSLSWGEFWDSWTAEDDDHADHDDHDDEEDDN